MDVEGVAETFGDELTLLGALQLRWHTRLAGRIERELMNQPMDLEQAVLTAWRATADELPGVLAIVDHYRAEPLDEAMAEAMAKSADKERTLLAVMAGRAGAQDAAAAARGCRDRGRGPGHRPWLPEPPHPNRQPRVPTHSLAALPPHLPSRVGPGAVPFSHRPP